LLACLVDKATARDRSSQQLTSSELYTYKPTFSSLLVFAVFRVYFLGLFFMGNFGKCSVLVFPLAGA
jgi:hypothetical protein